MSLNLVLFFSETALENYLNLNIYVVENTSILTRNIINF